MSLPRASYPTHKMILPSNKKEIRFRPYLVKEEKILLIATESNDEMEMVAATKQILRNCILDKDFDINEMTIFDMQYAFIQLRAKSVGEIAELKIICSKCDHANPYNLNFNDLSVIVPDDLDFKIPLDGGMGVVMRFPKVSILDDFAQKDLKDSDNAIALIMACIESIYDEKTVHNPHDETLEEQISWLESLGHDAMKKIEKFTDQIPALSETVEFECSECKHHNTRDVGGMSDFF